jgi:hypothetical protein
VDLKDRQDRIDFLLQATSPEQVLNHYDLEIRGRPASRKGGRELQMVCPFHDTVSVNFTMSDTTGLWVCRSSLCGVAGDLIQFVSRLDHLDHETAYLRLCQVAGVQPIRFDPLSVAMARMVPPRAGAPVNREKQEPIPWPMGYQVTAHPYLVESRGISPDVLTKAQAGVIVGNPFYEYRACVPILRKGHLYSIYSRRTSDNEAAWQAAHPDQAGMVGGMFRKHDYTGASLTSRLIYGIDDISGPDVILVESVISRLRLLTLGIPIAGSLLKASMSTDQLQQLVARGTKQLWVSVDNDMKVDVDTGKRFNPGMKAAWKIYRAAKPYMDVAIVELPFNRDPSDTTKPWTADEYLTYVANARRPQVLAATIAKMKEMCA